MLIGVGIDPGESESRISGWAERNSFFWPLAPVRADPVRDYRISQQSAAVGIDASGEIVLRKNGGLQGEDKWRDWLNTLSGKTAAAEPEAPSAAASPPLTDAGKMMVATASASFAAIVSPTAPPTTFALEPTVAPPPAPTAAVVAPPPTAIPVPTAAPPPPTATPRPAPTATPRPVPTATPNVPVGHNVGQRAPDFTVTAVNGETVTLSEVTASGKAVIVYFFATW